MSDLTYCLDCGMPVAVNEYHPFAACLMFRACGNTMVVRMNLDAVSARARELDATAAPVVVGEDKILADMVRRADRVRMMVQTHYPSHSDVLGGKEAWPGFDEVEVIILHVSSIEARLTAALAGDTSTQA